MPFDSANFTLLGTDALTGQQTADYDGGADTDANLQTSGYFPTTLGLVVGDLLLTKCTHSGVSGKIMTLLIKATSPNIQTSKIYANF